MKRITRFKNLATVLIRGQSALAQEVNEAHMQVSFAPIVPRALAVPSGGIIGLPLSRAAASLALFSCGAIVLGFVSVFQNPS